MNLKFYRKLFFPLMLLAGILSTTAFTDCGGKSKVVPSVAQTQAQINPQDSQVRRKTLLGVNLQSPALIPETVDSVVDASFARVAADARALGYTENLDASLYTVTIKQDCEASSDGTPAFRLRADDYDGLYFDLHNTLGEETDPDLIAHKFLYKKDGIGEIFAAEQMLTKPNKQTKQDEPYGSGIICLGSNELMSNTFRYFIEHELLFRNDRARYEATKNHGTSGIPHPLIAAAN